MDLKELTRIDFGPSAGGAHGAISGWDPPHQDRRWARGRRSVIVLPKPDAAGELLLLLTVDPFVFPPILLEQTLRVLVNGRTLRLTRVRQRTSLACRIDPALLEGRDDVELAFEHPDVTQPNMVSASPDQRGYSVAFVNLALLCSAGTPRPPQRPQPAAPLDPETLVPANELSDADLMGQFASLGDNCEFGIAQRYSGANPMDLLRFSGTSIDGLLRGLETGFAGIDELDHMEFDLRPADRGLEYVMRQRGFQMQAHTTIMEGDMPPARLFSREIKKLGLLSRLLMEDMTSARRIFVFKNNHDAGGAYGPQVLERLRRWGPNTLLHVVGSSAHHPPGTVEQAGEGLIRGYIDRFSPYENAQIRPSDVWRDLCRASYDLWRTSLRQASRPNEAEP